MHETTFFSGRAQFAPLLFFLLLLTAAPGFCRVTAARDLSMTFACDPGNDLFKIVRASGYACRRYTTAEAAVRAAVPRSAVLLLADGYPERRTSVSETVLEQAAQKELRLYVEFPDSLPGITPVGGGAAPQKVVWERVVVASDAFGSGLPRYRILMVPDCRFVPLQGGEPLLALARVAGFDKTPYGLPAKTLPLLISDAGRRLLVASTCLSRLRVGRFGPWRDWLTVWQTILERLDPQAGPLHLVMQPTVYPAYGPERTLPPDAEQQAFRRGADWYRRSRLLLTPERAPEIRKRIGAGDASAPMAAGTVSGDGSQGILEGFASSINLDGRQDALIALRADCNAEAGMVLALDASVNGRRASAATAHRLLDFAFLTIAPGSDRKRADPTHPAFGLLAWGLGSRAWEVANYGDDNARTILAGVIAASSLRSARWDAVLLRALYANLRTTGKLGFRGDRIDMPDLERNGWRHYFDAPPVNYALNFEAYLWACYLWAYERTRDPVFLERTKTAIRMTMAAYPQGWRVKDTMERARILLPLAWLVRVEDTAQHRLWLRTIATDLIQLQQPSGTLRELFAGGGGHYQAPASNEAYGTGEAPLAQQDGDPVSDQLYTTGFALLGLHEAAAAIGDRNIKDAEDRLTGYLCRIQARSTLFPFLEGAWLRAFDYRRWDYWASAADIGWGPWNVETGWGPAWINAVLALRQRRISVWEFTADSRIREQKPQVDAEMGVER